MQSLEEGAGELTLHKHTQTPPRGRLIPHWAWAPAGREGRPGREQLIRSVPAPGARYNKGLALLEGKGLCAAVQTCQSAGASSRPASQHTLGPCVCGRASGTSAPPLPPLPPRAASPRGPGAGFPAPVAPASLPREPPDLWSLGTSRGACPALTSRMEEAELLKDRLQAITVSAQL